MDGKLVELGVGLIAAIMVIREVLGFLDKKKFHNDGSTLDVHGAVVNEHVNDVRFAVSKVKEKVDDLHDWHNKRDADGVFNGYVRRSLEDVIKDFGAKNRTPNWCADKNPTAYAENGRTL